jgi:hypothetical protein
MHAPAGVEQAVDPQGRDQLGGEDALGEDQVARTGRERGRADGS